MPRLANYDDESAQRRAQAIEMYRAGASIEQIARRLNYSNITFCRREISAALAEVLKVPTEEAKALDLLRIDRMIMALWPDARNAVGTAIDRIVKLIDLRAKLIGTYSPVQVEQVTFDAVESEIKRLEGELGRVTPGRRSTRAAVEKALDIGEGRPRGRPKKNAGNTGTETST